jgi:hypothetical protein
MKTNWFTNLYKTVKLFLTNWIMKYTFYNIGWLGGFLICLFLLDWKLLAGVCAGIFIEKNRKQLALAWKDITGNK